MNETEERAPHDPPRFPNATDRRAHDNTPRNLAYITSFMLAACLLHLFWSPVPSANRDVLYMALGQLVTGWLMSLGYYYSTTARSHMKDQILMNVAKGSS